MMVLVSPMGRVILLVSVVLVLGSCTGESIPASTASLPETVTATSEVADVESSALPPTSVTTMVAVTCTTATVVVDEDQLWLYDGAYAAAWNRGDLDELRSYFAEDATFRGVPLGSPDLAADLTHMMAVGWRITWQDCEWSTPRYAECRARFTDDFVGPACLEYVGREQIWFDDAGLIAAYSATAHGSPDIYRFNQEFETWLKDTYPAIAPGSCASDDADCEVENDHAAVAVVPEFLAASSSFPVAETEPIPPPELTATVAGIALYNANADQQELVRWAIERFETAGLAFPTITHITFPPTEACATGVRGTAYSDGTEGHLDICAERDEFSGDADLSLPLQTSTLHEIAHLWTAQFIDAETQQAFLDQRGLQQWAGDVPWEQRGTEQAAEVLAWALLDEAVIWRMRDIPLFPRIPAATCEGLAMAYETLTGTAPTQRNADCTNPQ